MRSSVSDLLNKLFSATYQFSDGEYRHNFPVISSSHQGIIKDIVLNWYEEQMTSEKDVLIGELEAKVYTYEQIIAKSNFAPFITNNDDTFINEIEETE